MDDEHMEGPRQIRVRESFFLDDEKEMEKGFHVLF